MLKITYLLSLLIHLTLNLSLIAGDSANLDKTIKKYNKLCKSFKASSISAQQLKSKLENENYILIDVREKEEQAVSMLPNAISEKEFLQNHKSYTGKILVAYCTIGYRSGIFAEKHKDKKILNLEGGVLAWSHCKGKFFKKYKETKNVHVYSDSWNFLHSNYKAFTK